MTHIAINNCLKDSLLQYCFLFMATNGYIQLEHKLSEIGPVNVIFTVCNSMNVWLTNLQQLCYPGTESLQNAFSTLAHHCSGLMCVPPSIRMVFLIKWVFMLSKGSESGPIGERQRRVKWLC